MAPGECVIPISILTDTHCEEPVSNGRIKRFLNYKQKMQKLNLSSRINIAMKKVKTNQLIAGILVKYFKELVKSFVANDEVLSFKNTVKGTPAYWQRFLFEVSAMVKQLGLPTFFMTFSCADLTLNE